MHGNKNNAGLKTAGAKPNSYKGINAIARGVV
jgi:hypothetical protein